MSDSLSDEMPIEVAPCCPVLNHPVTGVAGLANKTAPREEQLNMPDVVPGRSCTRPTLATQDDEPHADFRPLGNMALRFA